MATVDETGVETPLKTWGSVLEACTILQCSQSSVQKYRRLGLIRDRKIPGLRVVICLDDCRKLASEDFASVQSGNR